MAITLKNIHKSFGKVQVLRGIDLVIPNNKVFCIVGASGAGKTTLLHIMGTIEKPDQGEVLYNDESVFNHSDKQLSLFRNQHIGFIFQFHHLLPEFTALENVCIPALIAGKNKKEMEEKAAGILSKLGLQDRLKHKPSALSGGEQQRVAVARALINDPDVILADEPSGNLDSDNARDLHELFFRLKDEYGQTFVIITHNEELADLSDQKIVMKDGILV
ncbi:MAG: ABC transporter ATP-binding protein [Bacteroidales bacterium]|nr:ABC transporter ATP-binding protein [Bacteroidales bacterium]